MKWCLIEVLICIFLMTNDIEPQAIICHLYIFFGEMSIQVMNLLLIFLFFVNEF
jgi:hypothetical protein